MLPHNTHTHPFNGPFSRTTWVGRYQKCKTNLDFTEARDSEWRWHQLGICKSAPRFRQITTPAPHHSVFYRPDALPAAQRTASKHWRHVNGLTHITKFATNVAAGCMYAKWSRKLQCGTNMSHSKFTWMSFSAKSSNTISFAFYTQNTSKANKTVEPWTPPALPNTGENSSAWPPAHCPSGTVWPICYNKSLQAWPILGLPKTRLGLAQNSTNNC